MSATIYEGDTLVCLVPVVDEEVGGFKNLTGATISAIAADIHGTTVDGDVDVTDAAGGKFTVTFSAGELLTGVWKLQARVVSGTQSQIVAEETITVKPGYV